MECRVCKSQMDLLEKIEGCRAEPVRVSTVPFDEAKAKISLYRCPKCTHIQIPNEIAKTHYDQYAVDNIGFFQYFGDLNTFDKKLERLKTIARNGNSFIEIGCGNGNFLEMAKTLFSNCIGIEPSQIGYETAKKKGLKVINSYFNDSLGLKNITAFAAMMVFEHLEAPLEVLKASFASLEEGGVGLINVPNGQLILQKNYYHQIISEHLNYYTPFSLATLAHNVGFDIVQIDSVDSLCEIDIYVSKPKDKKSMAKIKSEHKEKLNSLLRGKGHITVWGAGPKAAEYSELLITGLAICHLIDSDIDKEGKYIGGISKPVESVSDDILKKSDAVVIFASAYNEVILEQLKNEFHYEGTVIYFEEDNIKEKIFRLNA